MNQMRDINKIAAVGRVAREELERVKAKSGRQYDRNTFHTVLCS